MAHPRVTAAQVKHVLERAHKHGFMQIRDGSRSKDDTRPTLMDIARKMRMSASTLREYVYQHTRRLQWDARDPATWQQEKAQDFHEKTLEERERTRYQDQIERLRADLRIAYRQANADEDLRRAIFGLAAQTIAPPIFSPPKGRAAKTAPLPILFTSDFQWGEVISAAQLDGVNEFNLPTARARYERLIATTRDICRNHVGAPHARELIVLRGGDMVSGDIHDELKETNAAQSIGQVVDLVEHEAAGLLALRQDFERITVISIPGNHGRTTKKPQSKNYAAQNYDTLTAHMLEREFRKDTAFSFYTPASGDAIFDVYGWKFCLTHGDRIGSRGGQGFIGAAATIARGMKRVHEYYAKLGTHLDYILLGHFHSAMELEWGFANGSLPGMSEYARDFRATPARPSQLLLFVHPDHGVTSRWPIYLSPPVKMGAAAPAFDYLKAA